MPGKHDIGSLRIMENLFLFKQTGKLIKMTENVEEN